MEHESGTALAGAQRGRLPGLAAADLEAVFCGALLTDLGCGVALAALLTGREVVSRLDDSWPPTAATGR